MRNKIVSLLALSSVLYFSLSANERVIDEFDEEEALWDDEAYGTFEGEIGDSYGDLNTVNDPHSEKPAVKTFKQHYGVYGDFLYWNTYIPDYSWIYLYDNTGSPYTHDFKNANFNWDVGFRVGVNFTTTWQEVLCDLNWTRFHTQSHHTFLDSVEENANLDRGIQPFLINPYVPSQGHAYLAKGTFNVHLDQIDLTAKKNFNVLSNLLTLSPFMGARAIFLQFSTDQYFTYNYAGANFSTSFPKDTENVTEKDQTWGVGALVGLKGSLNIGKGLGFYFSSDAALVGGNDEVKRTSNSSIIGSTPILNDYVKENTKFHAIVDVDTGFVWDRNFSRDRWGIGLKVAYEAHMFFDAPTLVYHDDGVQNLTITFQGLTLGGMFRF